MRLADLRPGVRVKMLAPTFDGWAGCAIVLSASRDGVQLLREDRAHLPDRLRPIVADRGDVRLTLSQDSPAATRIRAVLAKAGLLEAADVTLSNHL